MSAGNIQASAAPERDPSARRVDGLETIGNQFMGWWERGRATFIRSRLRALVGPGDLVLDVGCGPATILGSEPLARGVRAVSCDSHRYPQWGTDHPYSSFVIAEADRLPFRPGVFDVVGSFDVLEHLVDDLQGLTEQVRVSVTDGSIVTAVPAFPSLWSEFDVTVGHHRRYTRSALAGLARQAALRPVRMTCFYAWLFPAARLLRGRPSREQEPAAGPGWISRSIRHLIGVICSVERFVLSRTDLPFGTSIWAEFERTPQ